MGDGSAKSAKISDGLAFVKVSGLKTGRHTAEIRATSAGGTSLLEWTFEVDGTPPVISSVAPQGVIRSDSANVNAVVSEDRSEVTTVTIAVDGKTTPNYGDGSTGYHQIGKTNHLRIGNRRSVWCG